MRYFKLILDDSNDNDFVCHCEDTHGFEQYDLKVGKYIKNWNENITFNFNSRDGNRFTDYLANNLGWFIISKKFKGVIKSLGVGKVVQYLPVNIVDSEGEYYVNEYYVANILEVVDALNLEKADYSVMEFNGEEIYSIRKYAVVQNIISNNHLFKLKGDEIPLFVSERFKQSVKKNNITGCGFLEIRVI